VIRVATDGTVSDVPVVTAGVFGTDVSISSGLQEQDVVVQYATKLPAPTMASPTGAPAASCTSAC
jgi:hypothetical protein